jgi:uncharacterized protein YcgI (DUF1989 family)
MTRAQARQHTSDGEDDGRRLVQELHVPAREAGFMLAKHGQLLQIVDLEGAQVGDLVAFVSGNSQEYLSPAHTCSCLLKLVPEVGDALYSNHRRALLRIRRDDVGKHDLMVPCCDPERYAKDFHAPEHPSCLASLQAAAAEFGADHPLRGELAINVFMNNVLLAGGRIETRAPAHGAGATLELEVLEDLIVGLAACPQDLTPCNNFAPSDMALRLWEERTA